MQPKLFHYRGTYHQVCKSSVNNKNSFYSATRKFSHCIEYLCCFALQIHKVQYSKFRITQIFHYSDCYYAINTIVMNTTVESFYYGHLNC